MTTSKAKWSAVVAVVAMAGAVQAASFSGIGDGFVYAISGDGTTAVGSASNGPFYWAEGTGLVNLVHHNQGQSSINATDVSADGKIIVGSLSSCSSGGCSSSPFLWTEQAGVQYPSYAGTIVSADGLVFVSNVCRRRSKFEPPFRPNIEPGVEADFEMVGCG